MSRFIQILNFLGILALAALCCVQWRANRLLNLQAVELEKTRLQQIAKIEEQEKAIKGYAADLDDFRQRLQLSEAALKDSQEKFRALAAERDKILAERDQLKASLDKFVAAIAERDAALKKAGDQIQKLVDDRNDAVAKFNDLAEKYNAIVKELDAARAKQSAAH